MNSPDPDNQGSQFSWLPGTKKQPETTRILDIDSIASTVDRAQSLAEYLWESQDEQELEKLATAAFSADNPNEDQIIGRRFHIYRCDALLGKGGMGRVYLAYHTQLARPCALKISSHRQKAAEPDPEELIKDEARSAASLIHPNIVTVHATGQLEGRRFIEMELVTGGSLKQAIRNQGQLPVLQALKWTSAIASGLDHAHRLGILHRDIKPENILICARGIPKLADFGLAQRIDRAEKLPEGSVCGTLPYLAPEALQSGRHTPASDIYSLGVSLYQMLTGRLPFHTDDKQELIQEILSGEYPSPKKFCSDLPLGVAEILDQMMAREPMIRPQNGTEAWHLLSSVLGQMRDIPSILEEAFGHDRSISWVRCENKYGIHVPLPNDRKQQVFLESSDHRSDQRLLLIYSVCCPVQPSFYERALRMNPEFSHGSLGIRHVDGADHFVMVDTYPRGTVDAEEVRKSVLELAEHSDRVEKYLTEADLH